MTTDRKEALRRELRAINDHADNRFNESTDLVQLRIDLTVLAAVVGEMLSAIGPTDHAKAVADIINRADK